MKHILFSFFIILFFTACSLKQDSVVYNSTKVKKLSQLIINSSVNIDISEAKIISHELVTHSQFLSKKYEISTPALIHNTLINLEIKDRGLCYHYANDLLEYIKPKRFKTFSLKKIIANRGEYFEHTALILTNSNISFKNSIVLDAWRDTGNLYFSKVKDDKRYIWELK